MKCIGNCAKCELPPEIDRMQCCAYQTLRQTIEIKTLLKLLQEKLEKVEASATIQDIPELEADNPEKKKK